MATTDTQDLKRSKQRTKPLAGQAAPAALCVLVAAGALVVQFTCPGPAPEWRALAFASLALSLSPFSVALRTFGGGEDIPFPLRHSAFFAASITLGPVAAALPALFHFISRLVRGSRPRRDVALEFYTVLKPSVAILGACLAYYWSGGSSLRPQAVDSLLPALGAGLVYMAANVALTAATPALSEGTLQSHRTPVVGVAWLVTLLVGYVVGVLYAVAPTYVLLGPCIVAGAAGIAFRRMESPEQEAEDETAPSCQVPVVEPQVPAKQTADAGSFVDPVTGLASEGYLRMFLQRELSRALRQGRPISVALFDLDGSRKTGTGGSEIEQALTALGERLKQGVRDYDLIARLSSNRLLVALPDTSAGDAYEVAVRLHEFATGPAEGGNAISASVGIATYPDHGSGIDDLVNAAHRVLNHGRLTGPNRVHLPHRLADTA